MHEPAPIAANKAVEIIGVASGAGALDPRCSAGPEALRSRGLADVLRSSSARPVHWADTLQARSGKDVVNIVRDTCQELAARVAQALRVQKLPVVLGGDHSCAIGTWKGAASALAARGSLGLLWIDAHLDAHVPQTSPSSALHGMPLAILLGYGDPRLVELAGGARLMPEHVCVVGVRSFESDEAALLQRLGVRIYFMDEIARRGLDAVMQEALAIVTRGTAGFGVTLDLDAIDPRDAPGVGSPVPNGLRGSELAAAFARLHPHRQLVGLEIAEYNPQHDIQGTTAELVEELLRAALTTRDQAFTAAQLMHMEQAYGAHHYDPLPIVLVRGAGVHVWDDLGRRYLDMLSAYSAVSLGHSHPRLVSALTEQAQRLAVTSRAYYNDRLPPFLKRLCELTGLDLAVPANTGVEAVEAAIKAARKWSYEVKGVPPERAEIICCTGNFHGRTIAALAMSSEPQYRHGFGPYPPGFVHIRYGDAQALAEAITPDTAAFLVEPIQGEAGIIVPPAGYLARCAAICRAHRVLLICDEVQTGLGRTGRLFACQHEDVQPDGIVLGKALGGGLLPVSAFVARREVLEVLKPGDHGSTFGGNPLAASVGLAALAVLVEDHLSQRAAELGEHLLRGLRALDSPLIREVRGKGLLTGIELDPAWVDARTACLALLRHGVLSKETHRTVLRLAPPLVITREEIDEALLALHKTLVQLEQRIPDAA